MMSLKSCCHLSVLCFCVSCYYVTAYSDSPREPHNIDLTSGDASIDIAWEHDKACFEDHTFQFTVTWQRVETTGNSEINTKETPTGTANIQNLEPNANYHICVSAVSTSNHLVRSEKCFYSKTKPGKTRYPHAHSRLLYICQCAYLPVCVYPPVHIPTSVCLPTSVCTHQCIYPPVYVPTSVRTHQCTYPPVYVPTSVCTHKRKGMPVPIRAHICFMGIFRKRVCQ